MEVEIPWRVSPRTFFLSWHYIKLVFNSLPRLCDFVIGFSTHDVVPWTFLTAIQLFLQGVLVSNINVISMIHQAFGAQQAVMGLTGIIIGRPMKPVAEEKVIEEGEIEDVITGWEPGLVAERKPIDQQPIDRPRWHILTDSRANKGGLLGRPVERCRGCKILPEVKTKGGAETAKTLNRQYLRCQQCSQRTVWYTAPKPATTKYLSFLFLWNWPWTKQPLKWVPMGKDNIPTYELLQ